MLCSKVARNDWPAEWPELFPTLIAHARRGGASEREMSRAVGTLFRALKELSSKKLLGEPVEEEGHAARALFLHARPPSGREARGEGTGGGAIIC